MTFGPCFISLTAQELCETVCEMKSSMSSQLLYPETAKTHVILHWSHWVAARIHISHVVFAPAENIALHLFRLYPKQIHQLHWKCCAASSVYKQERVFFFLLNWFFMELQHICRHFWSSCETVWRQKRETKTDCKNLMLAPRCLFAEKRRSEDFLAFRVSPKPVSVLEADISARITEMGEELFSGTSRGLWVDWTALLYMNM